MSNIILKWTEKYWQINFIIYFYHNFVAFIAAVSVLKWGCSMNWDWEKLLKLFCVIPTCPFLDPCYWLHLKIAKNLRTAALILLLCYWRCLTSAFSFPLALSSLWTNKPLTVGTESCLSCKIISKSIPKSILSSLRDISVSLSQECISEKYFFFSTKCSNT